MLGAEPGNGCMVKHRLALQQVHEIDVPPAGKFYPAGTENMIHPSIDNDGQHLPWRRQISIYPLIGLFQCRNIHTFNTMAKQADGIIFANLKFKIERKKYLITSLKRRIVFLRIWFCHI